MDWQRIIDLSSSTAGADTPADGAADAGGRRRARLLLLRRVANAAELRRRLIANQLGVANVSLVKASLVPDPFQLLAAANKAALAEARGRLTTRALSTEVVFNLSSTKNIGESLQRFGLGDQDEDLLAVVVSAGMGPAEADAGEKVAAAPRQGGEKADDDDDEQQAGEKMAAAPHQAGEKAVAVAADDDLEGQVRLLLDVVDGEERDMSELADVVDWDAVRKAHKVKNLDDRDSLARLLVSRTAAKGLL